VFPDVLRKKSTTPGVGADLGALFRALSMTARTASASGLGVAANRVSTPSRMRPRGRFGGKPGPSLEALFGQVPVFLGNFVGGAKRSLWYTSLNESGQKW
jgi:hypothetical protein